MFVRNESWRIGLLANYATSTLTPTRLLRIGRQTVAHSVGHNACVVGRLATRACFSHGDATNAPHLIDRTNCESYSQGQKGGTSVHQSRVHLNYSGIFMNCRVNTNQHGLVYTEYISSLCSRLSCFFYCIGGRGISDYLSLDFRMSYVLRQTR